MDQAKICFITAIYGNYESTCKKYVKQTVPTDFICFTDNPNMTANGWIVDTTPYHITHKSPLDNDTYVNSNCNNKHTFNIAKYYKQAFRNIPILQKYDVIVWLDGTVELIYDKISEYLLTHIYNSKIIGWHHEHRHGHLQGEVRASHFFRYTSTYWNGQHQPLQDIDKQYTDYLADGYDETFFNIPNRSEHLGVWITCFVAFYQKDNDVIDFLDKWYIETLTHTTQDQISFPYVCWKKQMIPMTLPNCDIGGNAPHQYTMFYIKHNHGQ